MHAEPLIFCAIDTTDMVQAKSLAGSMQAAGCGIKLGLEFFCAHGVDGVRTLRETYPELPLFLDLKFHDIPNTVAGAIRSVISTAPRYMTLHASGGVDMMTQARDVVMEEAAKLNILPPSLLAVTVLTSLDDAALEDVGQMSPSGHQVLRLSRLVQQTGLPGVVCSGLDIESLRASLGPDFVLMVPGIRPSGTNAQDQKRVMTPLDALSVGATHLVIGRPITAAPDPKAAALEILAGLQDFLDRA